MKKLISGIIAVSTVMSAAMFSPVTIAAEAPVLKAESTLVMAKDGSSVFGTGGAITAEALAAEFDGSVTVKNPGGEVVESAKKVPSGSTVSNDGGSVTVLISGDASMDGSINIGDVTAILKDIARWDVTIDTAAADVDVNGKINVNDVTGLLKYIAMWDVKLGNMKVIYDEKPIVAEDEDDTMALWFDHSTEKLEQSDVSGTEYTTYTISSAKNEMESCALYVSPSKDYADLHISMTDFVNSYGDKIESEAFAYHYVKLGDYGTFGDALMPERSTYKTKVKADKSQGYILQADVKSDAYPGLYEATVTLNSDGAEVKRAKVYLNVWDFALDDKDACDTAFGLSKLVVIGGHNVKGDKPGDQEKADIIFENYYDFLLKNRINGYTLPYDLTTEKGQAYAADPRVHSFAIAGEGYGGSMDRTDEQLAEYYEILQANPEWLEKGYFYYVDEPLPDNRLPDRLNAYNNIVSSYEKVQSKFPGGYNMIPIETHNGYGLTEELYDLTKGTVQVYCPQSYAFTPEKYIGTPGAQVFLADQPTEGRRYGSFEETVDSWVEDGTIKKLWWYNSCATLDPYPHFHAEGAGILPRVNGWQQYLYDVDGLLYYATQEYQGKNPYFDIEYYETGIYGDGILMYSGLRYGLLEEPIGSVRIEYIRDGIEDYMYLKMAERVIGEEATNEILYKVTKDMLDYTRDTDVLLLAREELAQAIMSANAE